MVQLSPSPARDVSPSPECSEKGRQGSLKAGSPKMGSPGGLSPLQLALAASTTIYQGYESYIEDGLICLKHKIRNLEKKKIKLEDYRKRLKHGESLNQDQIDAVEKYDEVIHNLQFAQELHKTLGGLTQELLKAQKKALRKEQMAKQEVERRRLCIVLQVKSLLQTLLQHEHIRKDLLSARNPQLQVAELQSLLELAELLGVKRDNNVSLEEQMERAALVYLDLLEGKNKPVAGTTYKVLKAKLAKLMDCGYFDCVPPPPSNSPKEVEDLMTKKTVSQTASLSTLMMSNKRDVPSREFLNRHYLPDTDPNGCRDTPITQNWKAEFQAMKEQEPPDSWDMESDSTQPVIQKPWRGAAVLISKVPVTTKKQNAEPKQRRAKSKRERDATAALRVDTPVEVFNSQSSLPKDPILRKQQLEDLMTKIRGSFSFMQDSLLDGEGSPTNGHPRLGRHASGSPSPLVQTDSRRSPVDLLPKTLHSTPLPSKLLPVDKPSLTNGDGGCLESCDLDLTTEDLAHVITIDPCLLLSESETACPSPPAPPPLYRRESSISITLDEKTSARTPISESGKQSPCNGVVPPCTPTPTQGQPFSTPPSRRTLTMAPPVPFQTMHSVFKVNATLLPTGDFKSDIIPYSDSNGLCYVTTSTQTPPEFAPSEDEHLQSGGSFIPHAHLYGARDTGYQHSYRRGGGNAGQRHNNSGWSDSSQVSSPDREGNYSLVDSAHGDSLQGVGMDLTPQVTPHAPHTLMHVPMYPLPQHPQPLRVAFTAARTANYTPGTLDQPIAFDQLHSNLGEMFNTVGRFTCPANGTYVFLFHILKLAVNVPLYVNLMRNDEVMVSAYANDGAPDHETASNHSILQLYQGDQVWLRLHRGSIYGSSWKYSTFSGFLLYQD
uniref:Caprin family member 2 n=1 Tax=Hucho hucho TaxID=62062 RepID=A0A4W5QMI8_9TELE